MSFPLCGDWTCLVALATAMVVGRVSLVLAFAIKALAATLVKLNLVQARNVRLTLRFL